MDIKEFDFQLHEAEVKMKRLKALYEQWFQGIEKMEPLIPKKDLERQLTMLRREKPRNTAARFRFQQLQARYNTYLTYWQRISRRIEEGTYERDLRRARRRRGGAAANRTQPDAKAYELDLEQEIEIDVDALASDNEIDAAINELQARESAPPSEPKPLSAFSPFAMGGDAKRASKPPSGVTPIQATFGRPKAATAPRPDTSASRSAQPRPAQPRPAQTSPAQPRPAQPRPAQPRPAQPRPAQPRPQGGPQPGMRKLYDDYVAARRRNNERVDNLPYAKLEKSIQQMKQKLRRKHGDKKIDFEVVVRNGRVGLKPKIE